MHIYCGYALIIMEVIFEVGASKTLLRPTACCTKNTLNTPDCEVCCLLFMFLLEYAVIKIASRCCDGFPQYYLHIKILEKHN